MRKAIRYRSDGGEARLGRLEGETVIDAGPSGSKGFEATRAAWDVIEQADGERRALGDVTLLAPVVPAKVLGVGLNYADHAAESGAVSPEHPMVFAKLPSSIIGPGEAIVVPFDEARTDYEAEVALVIGCAARRVTGDEALAAIGGVTAFNDVSGRDAQLITGGGQFTRGKSYDTFGPIGPAVVHPDDLDLDALGVRLVLSGETMQESNTRNLIFGPQRLIAWLSAVATLEPGDVIATGTPGGVGFTREPPRFLEPGDIVEVHVEGVGVLRNPVIGERVD